MGATLGDLLGDEEKSGIISESISIGDVYRMELTGKEGVKGKKPGDESRNKFFIVLGIEKGIAVGVILINTKINEGLIQSLKDLHYPLKASDYPFLTQDRFACCGELKSIDLSNFVKLFKSPKGKMKPSDIEYIKEAVISSPKTTPKELKRFGLIT